MPVVEIGEVISNEKIAENIFSMCARLPEMASVSKAGQFANIACGALTLRRPISMCDITQTDIRFVYEVKGEGTKYLSQLRPGDEIDVLGPLGNGFPRVENVLVVGGGIGVPPMLAAAKASSNADAVLGFRNAAAVILEDEFKAVCGKVAVTTDDGSYAEQGLVILPIERMLDEKEYDAVFACGPRPMLRGVYEAASKRGIECFVSMEERMGCGIGACLVCACALEENGKSRFGHVCKDGPVFDGRCVKW